MEVEGIGELFDEGAHWRLQYYECGHVQDLARVGLEDSEPAKQYVALNYASCLDCRLQRSVRAERSAD